MSKGIEMLMIMVKNPELGKVKTRLARSFGEEKALKIYLRLLKYTHQVVKDLKCDTSVVYSDYISDTDIWETGKFVKLIQDGDSIGERMMNAMAVSLGRGYKKVVVIGSDCYEITSHVIKKAFDVLDKKDVVLGPASDGGYYLIGMKKLHINLFMEKEWSTINVLPDTLLELKESKLSYELLETLSDIDEEEDLGKWKELLL